MRATPEGYENLETAVAHDIFYAEVTEWARRIGVEPKRIEVTDLKGKWGQCTSDGIVTFDTEVLRQHADFRKRVIVEELLHMKVPNHSKLFKTLLGAYLSGGGTA
jgi:predicted metal-dependent hydrolase